MMVISSGTVLFHPLVEIRGQTGFYDLLWMDKSYWSRCLLWHGWLPLLSGVNGGSPWADRVLLKVLVICLSVLLGPHTCGFTGGIGSCPVGVDAESAAERVAAEPDVWTDGSLVDDKVFGASSSGFGIFACRAGHLWADR